VKNFWQKLKKPIIALAPMANVTDAAFRKIIAKYGKPDVMWTEFVSADGLCSAGKEKLLVDLKFSRIEKPIVAQLFSGNPEKLALAAKLVEKLGFNGIDINMGCPDRSVEKSGAGAALIKNPQLARQLIRAVKENTNLPVSVKTRVGYNSIELPWLGELLQEDLAALTIHLRTRKEMSQVPAHWELMPKIIKLRNKINKKTLILGNGDISSVKEGIEKCKKYGCDGVVVGRGVFGNPWFFNRKKKEVTLEEKLLALIEHIKIFEKYFHGIKNFAVMKKHFKAYVSGFANAKDLRMKLMTAQNAKEAQKIIRDFFKES